MDAGYLSMTRGDGGQNLIGTESGELMGVLRTQELLAARRLDGAKQFFSRAIDFGYSKGPEETLRIWGKEQVLADIVRVIRTFRPDVIVTRFPATGEGGHGHHTASAILAEEAFKAAGDPSRFPEQLDTLTPWQPKRLLWNVFRFGGDTPRKDAPGQITADLGAYNALLGRSYTEIAALSRNMHKSQGFGSAERRGTWLNDFKNIAGAPAEKDLFEGVDLSWKRIEGGEKIGLLLKGAEDSFDPRDPSAVVPTLVKAYALLGSITAAERDGANSPSKQTAETTSRDGSRRGEGPKQMDPLLVRKRRDIADAIRACLGLWVEAVASEPSAAPGASVKVATMILNRSSRPATLESVSVTYAGAPGEGGALASNEPLRREISLTLPADIDTTQPYWLRERPGKGLFTVTDPALIGLPENPPPLVARFTVRVDGVAIPFEAPVVFRRTDPVKGEMYRPFVITPPVTATFDEKVYAFGTEKPKKVRVTLTSGAAVSGVLRLKTEAGFSASPAEVPFAFTARGEEKPVAFTVTPPAGASAATLTAEAVVSGKSHSRGLVRVDYPHIPPQTLFPPAEAKVLRLDVKAPQAPIGYVMGSGDEVPDALRQMGYTVTLLSDDELENGDLSRYAAIVTGIRAYNTRPRLKVAEARLVDYVEKGGTLVAQYNTLGRPRHRAARAVPLQALPRPRHRRGSTREIPEPRELAPRLSEQADGGRLRRVGAGARPLLPGDVGPPLRDGDRDARSGRERQARRPPVRTAWEGRVRLYGIRVLPAASGRRPRRLPLLREPRLGGRGRAAQDDRAFPSHALKARWRRPPYFFHSAIFFSRSATASGDGFGSAAAGRQRLLGRRDGFLLLADRRPARSLSWRGSRRSP